ncbi:MAG TPA: maleylpyruvate isomerase N-terminal domain-containing protein [Actinomycetota bacterium]
MSWLDDVHAAEERFKATVAGLDDEDLHAPSLCPGWSRGHVIAHVALNADSLVNLIAWARTGSEVPQYPSPEARDADIERHSRRSTDEHLRYLDEAAERFARAARDLPADKWSFPVRGIGGTWVPVERYRLGRLSEVEIHHVDLDAG